MGKTNVVYGNTEYVVRSNQNQVICILDFSIKFTQELSGLTSNIIFDNKDTRKFLNDNNLTYRWINEDELYIYGKTYGYADCLPEDEFDDVFGKKLAQTRAQMKAFDIATKVYNEFYSKYQVIANKFITLANSSDYSADKCSLHANDLILNKYEF